MCAIKTKRSDILQTQVIIKDKCVSPMKNMSSTQKKIMSEAMLKFSDMQNDC